MAEVTVTRDTAAGPARVHVAGPARVRAPGPARVRAPAYDGRGLVVLGHGAGGGVDAPDLVAVRDALVAAGWTVARVEQPYRVRGRRAPDRPATLDAAWIDVVLGLRVDHRGPLVVGGRSSGARVACRCAATVDAAAVICLAFPLHPPARPEASRAEELRSVGVPTLVVQGERDPFGAPGELPSGPTVVAVPGDHSLRRSAATVAEAVRAWLDAQALA